MKKLLNEFKEFAMKGNMIDLAIGVIIGGAFNKIVTSLVNDIIMPVISLFTGKIDFTNLFISLNGQHYNTLEEAQKAGAATLNYGAFLSGLLDFLIMAFVVFLLVKQINYLRTCTHKEEEKEEKVTEKVCPFCKSTVDIEATRCPHCTSELPLEESVTAETEA